MIVALMLILAVLLLAALGALLFGAGKGEVSSAFGIKELLPVHCTHFAQVRQILSREDDAFLAARAPQAMLKQWRAERSFALLCYVQGLAEDFRNLRKLARVISALSPQLKQSQEWELLVLGFKFQVLYRLTLLRLAARRLPLEQTARLTEIVSTLGMEMRMALDAITRRASEIEPSTAN